MSGRSERQKKIQRRAVLLRQLRAEYESVVSHKVRIGAATPALTGLILATWRQPGARNVEYCSVEFPVRAGDDWARTVCDPITRQPLFATDGGWLI